MTVGTLRDTAQTKADKAATEQVVREHGPFIWRALRALGVAEADLPDVCQEVFLTVHRKLGGFEGRSTLSTWLFGVCIRLARTYRRGAARRREEPRERLPDTPSPANQLETIAQKERQLLLLDAINALRPKEREVFVLHEVEEMPMTQVAEAVDCPLRTAYALRDRARAHICRYWKKAVRQGRVSP